MIGASPRVVVPAALVLVALAAFAAAPDGHFQDHPGAPERLTQRLERGWGADAVLAAFDGRQWARARYRGADLAGYLQAGETLLERGRFDQAYARLWPPGMAVLAAVVLAVARERYVLGMIAWTVLLWGLALVSVLRVLAPRRPRELALGLALAALALFLPAHGHALFGFGAVMSESPATALFVVGASQLLVGLTRVEPRPVVLGGLLLALATLVRAYFEYAAGGALAFTAVALAVVAGAHRLRARRWTPDARRSLRAAGLAALAVLVMQAGLLPWRGYKRARFGHTSLVRVDDAYALKWSFARELPPWMRAGNAACVADPETCDRLAEAETPTPGRELKRLTLQALLQHPLAYAGAKLRHLDWFWMGRDGEALTPALKLKGLLLAALGGLGLVGLLAALRRGRRVGPALALALGFLASNAAIFAVLHFEWRYSLPLRAASALLPVWAWAAARAVTLEVPTLGPPITPSSGEDSGASGTASA